MKTIISSLDVIQRADKAVVVRICCEVAFKPAGDVEYVMTLLWEKKCDEIAGRPPAWHNWVDVM